MTLANIGAHKRRLVSTFTAVVLGVAFLAGVLVQTATLQHKFDVMFDTSSAEVDAVVRSDRSAPGYDDGERIHAPLDPAVLDRVRLVPGVADAQADWEGTAVVIGADGDPLGTNGPPKLGLTWHDDPELSAYRIVDGRAPVAPDEVVLAVGTASDGDLSVGDRTTVLVPDEVAVTVVGLATFGGRDSAGPTTTALFSEAGARAHLATRSGGVDGTVGLGRILLTAAPGVDDDTFASTVRAAAGDGTETLSRSEFRAENRDGIDDVMNFLRPALLSFALIALLVAAFSIYNTFAIIVAQRTREAGLLRAIGASRSQTLRAVLAESALVGLVASIVGLGLGLLVAVGLGSLLARGGLGLPGGLLLAPATSIGCVVVGTVVTVLCALGPAVRASRVAPMQALRAADVDQSATSVVRLVIGSLTAAAAVVGVLWATVGSGGMAAGGLAIALGVLALVVLGPIVAAPAGRVIGLPLRLRGVTGDLARLNAVRNPRRTASSSAALMIGVAIVALFTVLAASITATVDDQIRRQVGGDLVVTALGGTVPPGTAAEVAEQPEVATATGFGPATLTLDGQEEQVITSDVPTLTGLLETDPVAGDMSSVVGDRLAVSQAEADRRGWAVGDTIDVERVDGTRTELVVGAVYRTTDLLGDVLVPRTVVVDHGQPLTDFAVMVELADGVSVAAGRAAIERTVADLPTVDVMDRDELSASIAQEVNTVLYLVYGMLALSIVIALMGIANTLSLSTLERTRELGLLRAVGQTRRQARAMIRLESVVVAVYGTALGMAVGVLGAWVLVASDTSGQIGGFTVPADQLAVVLALGALAGVVAAIRPASRASRRQPLEAIAGG
ncbi:MAG: FtsX-like permease family protein [Actinobacteria bacterium]|nr:FtsX-like permease family protein [Actinomycetota bacterium]